CRPLRRHPAQQNAGGRPRRGHRLRRLVLREYRHARIEARRIQTEFRVEPRRIDLAYSEGSYMNQPVTKKTSPVKLFHGKYRGTVVQNIDPELRGRIMCEVPDVLGLVPSSWCEAC